MKTITPLAALGTALLIGTATLAVPTTRASAEDLRGIEWTASLGAEPTIEFSYRTSNTSLSIDNVGGDIASVRTALNAGGSTAFTIEREPGTLTCSGTLSQPYDGRGTCTFTSDKGFAADLEARHVPARGSELLAMALLGANRAMIDGLIQQGVAARSSDDVIAAAALKVTPEYVAGLQKAGLDLRSLEDAIACRALDVDAGYVQAMADAGYHATSEQIIAMKATGVTPEYARRMNAAAQN